MEIFMRDGINFWVYDDICYGLTLTGHSETMTYGVESGRKLSQREDRQLQKTSSTQTVEKCLFDPQVEKSGRSRRM